MSLKTNYKDDKYEGMRKYKVTNNADGTISLEDKTNYVQDGDVLSASMINEMNHEINSANGITVIHIPKTGWGLVAPYIQMIEANVLKTSTAVPGILYPDDMNAITKTQIDKSSNMITEIETLDGEVKITCKFEKPITDLDIGLKGVLL